MQGILLKYNTTPTPRLGQATGLKSEVNHPGEVDLCLLQGTNQNYLIQDIYTMAQLLLKF